MSRRYRAEDGMVTVWSVVMVLACMAMVGLVLDGGVILRARSSAFDIAAESARAGAQELDQDALADGRIVVDAGAAHERIAAYLAAHDVNGDITITAETVTVTVHRQVGLQILQPATVDVHQTATVRAHKGRP
jgi:Flp pilus assembly protein TadG